MSIEIVTRFLGCSIDEWIENPDQYVSFTYRSKKLVYGVSLDLEQKIIGVSADFNDAFGYACISEVSAEYDQISIEFEPNVYGEDEILVCKKDFDHATNVATLKLKKWESGELSIWMSRIEKYESQENN